MDSCLHQREEVLSLSLSASLFLRLNVYQTRMYVFIHLLTSGTNSIHASFVGREGAKTLSPFLERAMHSSEGRDTEKRLSPRPFLERPPLPPFCSEGKKSCHLSKDSYIFIPSALGREISFLAPYVLCIITERIREMDGEREREREKERNLCPAEHTIVR